MINKIRTSNREKTWISIKRFRSEYLLLVIPTALVIVFCYMPIYGVIIAFKDFKPGLGIWGSPWNNFSNFKELFTDHYFIRAFKNTVVLSLLTIGFGFPAPIIFALLLNEIFYKRFKKIVQSISYLPHFISWVVLAGIITDMLSPQYGMINYVLQTLGIQPIYFLASNEWFRPVLIFSGIWQSVGWGSVIYIASMASIDPGLYESAVIDGAGRFKKVVHITVPSIANIIIILFILTIGGILNSNFDQIFNLYNPIVYDVADVIDTYVYRAGLINARFDYSTAVGLFKNVVGICLIFGTNIIVKKYSEYTIW
jgi:putative aldouronate transport system permease protein